jgi:SAM-dependent methyltransferase
VTRDYSTVTEVTGEAVRRDAVEKMQARYAFAAARAEGKDVLEVACGSGQGLGMLARTARRVIGGDYTFKLVAEAARHYQGRVGLICLNAQSLPFADATFDLVLCYEALYYFPDAGRFCAEAARVLRPGGELIVVNVNPEWAGFNPSPYSVHYHSAAELLDLLERCGLRAEVSGAFPEPEAGFISRGVGVVRRLAVGLHLVPKTMRAKRLLKRVFYGRLTALPAELVQLGSVPALDEISPSARRHTVLYAVASQHRSRPR